MTPTQLFRNLVAAAHVDGEVAPEEIGVLVRYQERLGLSDADRQRTFDEVGAAPASFRLPTGEPERRTLFEAMCELALADGELSSAERRLLESVAARFGYSASELSAELERAGASPPEPQSANEPARETAPTPWSGADRFWLLTGLFLGVFLVWTSGLLDGYTGPVTKLQRTGGENESGLLVVNGQSHGVPERVYVEAQVGSTVEKKLLQPWWTVDGAVLWGPSGILLLFLIPAGACLSLSLRVEPPRRLPLGLAVFLAAGGLASCGRLLLQTEDEFAPLAILAAIVLPLLWGGFEWTVAPQRKRLAQC